MVAKLQVLLYELLLIFLYELNSPREIKRGEEIAWYPDGETILRNEEIPSIAYAYGMVKMLIVVMLFIDMVGLILLFINDHD